MNALGVERSFFSPRWLYISALVTLFGLGLGIRLYDLTNLPLDFHPTRQLLSGLKARGMFYQTAPGIPDWQRQMSLQQWQTRAEVEPEVVEQLAAFTYRFTGEHLWVGRVYSSLFWVLGGIFLFLLVQDVLSTDGAVVSTAYYLLLPYAVTASRAFQPDPLMVMLTIAFWWTFHRWAKRPSWVSAILAGLLGGFAIFAKFVAAFFVIGAALGEAVGRYRWRELIRKGQVWLITVLGVLPGGAYLFYGVVLHEFLGRQFNGRFVPALLLSPANYLEWVSKADMTAGLVAILLGVLGLFLVRERSVRSHLIGLWIAYVLFGLYFNYNIATHDYYQEPLIPLVAISLAPVADWIMTRLAESTVAHWMRIAAFVVLLLAVFSVAWEIRNELKAVDYRPQAAVWEKIGALLNHSPGVAALTQDYGNRLAYWGWQNASIWPNSGDLDYHEMRGASFPFYETFNNLTRGKRYFLVTDFVELNRQPQLKGQLAGFAVYAQGAGYVIYDLSRPIDH